MLEWIVWPAARVWAATLASVGAREVLTVRGAGSVRRGSVRALLARPVYQVPSVSLPKMGRFAAVVLVDVGMTMTALTLGQCVIKGDALKELEGQVLVVNLGPKALVVQVVQVVQVAWVVLEVLLLVVLAIPLVNSN